MTKLIYAVKAAEVISERFNIPLADLVDVFAEVPSVNPYWLVYEYLSKLNWNRAEADEGYLRGWDSALGIIENEAEAYYK